MEYEKLDPEFKAQWLVALRSGEYQQGKSRLYLDGYYCCLGVAGCVAGVEKSTMDDLGFFDRVRMNYGRLPGILYGFATHGLAVKLSQMNDEGKSFSEIADWIEANL